MPKDTSKTVQKVDNKGTDKKKKPDKTKKKKSNFFKETVQGLKRVSWPTRKELFSATGAVLVFVLAVGLLVAGLDEGFRRAMFQPLTGVERMSAQEKRELKENQQLRLEALQAQLENAQNNEGAPVVEGVGTQSDSTATESDSTATESSIQPEIVYEDGSTGSNVSGTAPGVSIIDQESASAAQPEVPAAAGQEPTTSTSTTAE